MALEEVPAAFSVAVAVGSKPEVAHCSQRSEVGLRSVPPVQVCARKISGFDMLIAEPHRLWFAVYPLVGRIANRVP